MPVLYRWQYLTGTFLPTPLPALSPSASSGIESNTAVSSRHSDSSASYLATFDATGNFIVMGDALGSLYLLSAANLSCLQVYKSQQTYFYKDIAMHSGGTSVSFSL
jgi:hypothetical protein